MKAAYIVNKGRYEIFDVFGPTVGFLTSPSEADAVYCMMQGTIPPGVSVPLHSHPDDESFYILSGVVQALTQQEDNFQWMEVKAGDFVHVQSGAKHAWKNPSNEPVEGLITTTPKLGRFFQEVGRRITPGERLSPPTSEELQHFMEVAARYHHWLGSPEENAAVEISTFG